MTDAQDSAPEPQQVWMSIDQCAAALGLSTRTVRRCFEGADAPPLRWFGGSLRVRADLFNAWANSRPLAVTHGTDSGRNPDF